MPKSNAGSHGKYTQERVDIIIDSIENLKGRYHGAKAAGICYDTFCEWMKTHPEFVESVKGAESAALRKGKEVAIMSIFRAMPKQWQSAAWWLERKFNSQFALRQINENEHRFKNVSDGEITKRIAEEIAQLIGDDRGGKESATGESSPEVHS